MILYKKFAPSNEASRIPAWNFSINCIFHFSCQLGACHFCHCADVLKYTLCRRPGINFFFFFFRAALGLVILSFLWPVPRRANLNVFALSVEGVPSLRSVLVTGLVSRHRSEFGTLEHCRFCTVRAGAQAIFGAQKCLQRALKRP